MGWAGKKKPSGSSEGFFLAETAYFGVVVVVSVLVPVPVVLVPAALFLACFL